MSSKITKISKLQLRKIIREEVTRTLNEMPSRAASAELYSCTVHLDPDIGDTQESVQGVIDQFGIPVSLMPDRAGDESLTVTGTVKGLNKFWVEFDSGGGSVPELDVEEGLRDGTVWRATPSEVKAWKANVGAVEPGPRGGGAGRILSADVVLDRKMGGSINTVRKLLDTTGLRKSLVATPAKENWRVILTGTAADLRKFYSAYYDDPNFEMDVEANLADGDMWEPTSREMAAWKRVAGK